MEKNGFTYTNNIKSSYDEPSNNLTIFNMDYLITEKVIDIQVLIRFQITMTKFDETMAGKTLKEINYDFY